MSSTESVSFLPPGSNLQSDFTAEGVAVPPQYKCKQEVGSQSSQRSLVNPKLIVMDQHVVHSLFSVRQTTQLACMSVIKHKLSDWCLLYLSTHVHDDEVL